MRRFIIILAVLACVSTSWAWVSTTTFEGGTVGTKALGGTGFNSDAGNNTTFSATRAAIGSQSARMVWPSGETGFEYCMGEQTYTTIPYNGEIWMRGYFYFATPWSWTCDPVIKIMRVHVRTAGGTNRGYLSFFAGGTGEILYSNEVSGLSGYTDQGPEEHTGVYYDTNAWQALEIYVKFSNTAPIVRMWKNGTLVFEDTSATYVTMGGATDVSDMGYMMGYWNGGVPQNQTMYVDDWVITNTQPSTQDADGNYMIGTGEYSGGDITSPTVSDIAPSGEQVYAAGAETISCTTNEAATCRWGTLSLSDYYSYSNVMTGGGTTSHTADLTGLSEGTTYTRYGRCIDASGNQSTTFTWSWSYPASGGGLSPATLRGKFSGGYFK